MDSYHSHPDYSSQLASINQILSPLDFESVCRYLRDNLDIRLDHMQRVKTNGVVNFIYSLQTDWGKLYLRIANPHPYWEYNKTANQVAIAKLIQSKLDIPIPQIVDFSVSSQLSPLKCQFILSKFIENDGTVGEYLDSIRGDQDILDKCKILIRDGMRVVSQLTKLELNIDFIATTSLDYKPSTIRWDGPAIGPFRRMSELFQTGLLITIQHLKSVPDTHDLTGAISKVIAMLQSVDVDSMKIGPYVWRHGDLHMGNISVKNGTINGVYDWQTARTGLLQESASQNQCDFMGWFQELSLSKQQLSQLEKYQASLIQQYHLPIQPHWPLYQQFFEIMMQGFYCWFYTVSWYREYPLQKIPSIILQVQIAQRNKLRAMLMQYKYL